MGRPGKRWKRDQTGSRPRIVEPSTWVGQRQRSLKMTGWDWLRLELDGSAGMARLEKTLIEVQRPRSFLA